MLFNKPSNTTTGFLLQTMLYVANITKNDVNIPHSREEFLANSPMGADSGSNTFNLDFHFMRRCVLQSIMYHLLLHASGKNVHFQLAKYSEKQTIQLQLRDKWSADYTNSDESLNLLIELTLLKTEDERNSKLFDVCQNERH